MGLACWKCGVAVEDEPIPLSREAECRACRAPLHVCRMCRFFDPAVANACREPVAEPVQEKTRANFCGYLEPVAGTFRGRDVHGEQAARDALDALFSGPGKAGKGKDPQPDSEEEAARKRLEDLFGGDNH